MARCTAALVAALCAVASAPVLASAVPPEPYRFLLPPVGYHNRQPSLLQETVKATGGRGTIVVAMTHEQGPQLLLVIPAGQLVSTVESASITVTGRAEPPAAGVPGAILGNAYQLAAVTTGGQAARLTPSSSAYIQMRIPQQTSSRVVVELLDDGRWRALPTKPIGTALYQATLPAFGMVVAAVPSRIKPVERTRLHFNSFPTEIAVPAGVAVIALIAFGVWRRWVRARRAWR